MTKTEFLTDLQAKHSNLSRADLTAIMDSISGIVTKGLKTGGVAVIPGIVKLTAVQKPATPARRGIDPFTKKERDFPAKPASLRVKASVVKSIKDAV